jgi:hypothetical protein
MKCSSVARCATSLALTVFVFAPPVRAAFDLAITVSPTTGYTAAQLAVLQESIATAEAQWESYITGYQPGISLSGISITVSAGSAFGDATLTGTTNQGGFLLATGGRIRIAPSAINDFGSWNGVPGPDIPNPALLGMNFVDDLVAHEIGHVLGIGSLWVSNGLYVNGTGRYTGQHGVAAFRAEFDANATFVPVELAGSAGRPNVHWDQIFRSTVEEGDPNNSWNLDPRLGITDQFGRDFALDVMTGAIDPDWGGVFFSKTTIQSLRDLGFTVVPEPGTGALLGGAVAVLGLRQRRRVSRDIRDGVGKISRFANQRDQFQALDQFAHSNPAAWNEDPRRMVSAAKVALEMGGHGMPVLRDQ